MFFKNLFKDFIDKGANKNSKKTNLWENFGLFITILTSVTTLSDFFQTTFGNYIHKDILLAIPPIIIIAIGYLTYIIIKIKKKGGKSDYIYFYQNSLRNLAKAGFVISVICVPLSILKSYTSIMENHNPIKVVRVIQQEIIHTPINTLDTVSRILEDKKTDTVKNKLADDSTIKILPRKLNKLSIDLEKKIIDVIVFNNGDDVLIDTVKIKAFHYPKAQDCCCPPDYIYDINQNVELKTNGNIEGKFEEKVNYSKMSTNWTGSLYIDGCTELQDLTLALPTTLLIKKGNYTNVRFLLPENFESKKTITGKSENINQSDYNYIRNYNEYKILFFANNKLLFSAVQTYNMPSKEYIDQLKKGGYMR